jgi:hypothetical protein
MSGSVLEITAKPTTRGTTLGEEEAETLAYAVLEIIDAYLVEHLASAAELTVCEALDDVVEVDCDAGSAGGVAFVFHEHWPLGAACGHHWYAHALAACWGAVTKLFGAHGQRVTAKRPDVDKLYAPQRSGYVLGVAAGDVVAVHSTGEVIVPRVGSEDAVVQLDDASVDEATREVAARLYATGLCECSLCGTARPHDFKVRPIRRRVEPPPPFTLALAAARSGNIAELERVIVGGGYVDLERCMEEGVSSPDARVVSHLIARGVNVTPEVASCAARANAVAALSVLHAHGIDLTALDSMGRSPLANACSHGGLDALRYLLELGADLEAVDRFHGDTALLWAFVDARNNGDAVTSALLAAGASRHVRNKRGWGVDEYLDAISDPERKAAFARALRRCR